MKYLGGLFGFDKTKKLSVFCHNLVFLSARLPSASPSSSYLIGRKDKHNFNKMQIFSTFSTLTRPFTKKRVLIWRWNIKKVLPIIATSSTHYNYILATNKKIHINVNKWPEVGICQGSAHSFRGRVQTGQTTFSCIWYGSKSVAVFGRPGVSPLLLPNVVF